MQTFVVSRHCQNDKTPCLVRHQVAARTINKLRAPAKLKAKNNRTSAHWSMSDLPENHAEAAPADALFIWRISHLIPSLFWYLSHLTPAPETFGVQQGDRACTLQAWQKSWDAGVPVPGCVEKGKKKWRSAFCLSDRCAAVTSQSAQSQHELVMQNTHSPRDCNLVPDRLGLAGSQETQDLHACYIKLLYTDLSVHKQLNYAWMHKLHKDLHISHSPHPHSCACQEAGLYGARHGMIYKGTTPLLLSEIAPGVHRLFNEPHVPEIFCTLLWQVSENMFDLHVLKCSAKHLSTSKHAIRQWALLMQQIKLAFQKHRIYNDLPQCAGILRLLYHLLMRCYWYSFPCNLTNND